MIDNRRTAQRLREVLDLPEVTDEEILSGTKGSLTRASVEFNLAARDLRDAFADALRKLWRA